RSSGPGGERTEAVEDFVADGGGRLVLDVSYDEAKRDTAYTAATRPHAHHYTILAVAAARRDGELRVAATGLKPHAVRLTAVEQGGDASAALAGIEAQDDPLASGWYRAQVLPKLVERALADLS
ncbi:MAG TPA: hypothetical protein VJT84_00680, partial [Gaiellaceae bacterium]|nr:hypothetical protein [Gaiellaceae bacterium]